MIKKLFYILPVPIWAGCIYIAPMFGSVLGVVFAILSSAILIAWAALVMYIVIINYFPQILKLKK